MGKITITSGPDADKEYPLGDSQVIGRLGKCSIPLKDSRASREHARIYKSRGAYFVVDLNSKNGISVNGEPVTKVELSPGDRVQVGETWMQVDFDPETLAAASPSAGTPLHATPMGGGVEVRGTGGISAKPIRTEANRRNRTGDMNTRTSLAWLRTDLSQVSGLYRTLMMTGLFLLMGGLGYLCYLALV